MLFKLFIIWVTLTLTSLSARAGFDGFPLSASTNDIGRNWLTAQEGWQPVRKIVNAIEERRTAVHLPPLQYVENVVVETGMVTNAVEEVIRIVASGFPESDANGIYTPWFGYYVKDGTPTYYIEEDYLLYETGWTISRGIFDEVYHSYTGPASSNWRDYYTEVPVAGITTESITPAYIEVYQGLKTISITNQFGNFSVAADGTNYTGITYVTRDLLDYLWASIEELSEHYVLPGDEDWDEEGFSAWDSWFSGSRFLDYRVPAHSGWLQPYIGGSVLESQVAKETWGVQPYLLKAYPAIIYDKLGFTNSVYNLQSNDWGIVTSGEYRTLPVLNADYESSVVLAEATYGTNTGWQTGYMQIVTNRHGADLEYYADYESRVNSSDYARLKYTGTGDDPGISATISGVVAVLLPTNTITTNLYWNTQFNINAELTSAIETNTTWYLSYSNATETLNTVSGDRTAHAWAYIDSFHASGTYTTDVSVALLWDVRKWEPISYRLYAEELDRMYYALKYMRFSLAVEGVGGNIVGGVLPTNIATYTASSLRRDIDPRIEPWMQGIIDTWGTNAPPNSSRTNISISFPGAEYSVAEWDRGGSFDKYYYEGPASNVTPKDVIAITNDTALPPWHWPQTLEIGYFQPADPGLNTPVGGWPVIIGRTIDDRPPSKEDASAWMDSSFDNTFGAYPSTNKTLLPYALHNRLNIGSSPYNIAMPPYDDYLEFDSDYDVWTYAGNGGEILYTNGVPKQTGLQDRPTSSTDGLFGWAGNASLVFDYELPDPTKFSSAKAYYGQFTRTAQSDTNVVDWLNWEHPYTATVTNTYPFADAYPDLVYPRIQEGAISSGKFPPLRYLESSDTRVFASYLFKGNDLLAAPFTMESKVMELAGSSVSFNLSPTNAVPVSPGIASTPQYNEFAPNAKIIMQRWAGCAVSEMFFIIHWDFEYK
jgi:hypothetical protein